MTTSVTSSGRAFSHSFLMACELFSAAELHDLDEIPCDFPQFRYSDAVGEVLNVHSVLRSQLPDETSFALLDQVISRHDDLFCLFSDLGFRELAVCMLDKNIQHLRSNSFHDKTSCLTLLPFRLGYGREEWRTSNQDTAVDSFLHTIGRHDDTTD